WPLRSPVHLADLDGEEVGRVPALHRCDRPVLLHDRVGHFGLADDVRVLTRPGRTGPPVLAARLEGRPRAHLHCLGDLRARVLARDPDALLGYTGYVVSTSVA